MRKYIASSYSITSQCKGYFNHSRSKGFPKVYDGVPRGILVHKWLEEMDFSKPSFRGIDLPVEDVAVLRSNFKRFLRLYVRDGIKAIKEKKIERVIKGNKCIAKADLLLVDDVGKRVVIVDYKTSGVPISAFENLQLLFTAAIVPYKLYKKTGVILNLFMDDPYTISKWEIPQGAIDGVLEDVARSDSEYVMGDHCKNCSYILECPEVEGLVGSIGRRL